MSSTLISLVVLPIVILSDLLPDLEGAIDFTVAVLSLLGAGWTSWRSPSQSDAP